MSVGYNKVTVAFSTHLSGALRERLHRRGEDRRAGMRRTYALLSASMTSSGCVAASGPAPSASSPCRRDRPTRGPDDAGHLLSVQVVSPPRASISSSPHGRVGEKVNAESCISRSERLVRCARIRRRRRGSATPAFRSVQPSANPQASLVQPGCRPSGRSRRSRPCRRSSRAATSSRRRRRSNAGAASLLDRHRWISSFPARG